MNIGELKIESLKLMFVNNGEDIDIDNSDESTIEERLEALSNNEIYSVFLSAMNGAINRAIARISSKRLLPPKTYKISTASGCGQYVLCDLVKIIDDFYALNRVTLSSANVPYCVNVPYVNEEYGKILLQPTSGIYTIIYTPKAQYISSGDSPAKQLDMPVELALAIPYFVKAELYEEDEPALAAQARNIFEQNLEEYRIMQTPDILPTQTNIKSIYHM